MKLTRPPFFRGEHYRRITKRKIKRTGKSWKYNLLENATVKFEKQICFGTYYLHDGNDACWGCITPYSITVFSGYSWDGSSCSPDLEGVMLASLIHDLLYQFSGVANFPLSRQFADSLFYALSTSPLAFLYRAGLFVGSWTCWGKKEPGAHIISP